MSYLNTIVLDDKHREDLEEFIEQCQHEFFHCVKQRKYELAQQWLIDIVVSYNTLRMSSQDQ